MFTPGERDVLLVNFYNHIPNAERIATEADVRWAGPKPMATAIEELDARGARGEPGGRDRAARLQALRGARRVRVAGPARRRLHAAAAAQVRRGARLAPDRLRVHRRAPCARSTSRPAAAPTSASSETSPSARTWAAAARPTSTTSACPSPPSGPRRARSSAGDVLSCEISASYWDYTGQLLRTFTVADDPPPLYRELHDVADAAFDALFERVRPGATAAELVEASARDRRRRLHDPRRPRARLRGRLPAARPRRQDAGRSRRSPTSRSRRA